MTATLKGNQQREYQRQQTEEELRDLRTPKLRVYSRRLPHTLWYHGTVPERVTDFHEVARLVGLTNVVSGVTISTKKRGHHWLLLEGTK